MRDRRPPARRRGALLPAGLCSVPVLAALGLLTLSAPGFAQGAGGTLPAGTLPVLRGVVAGQVAVNRSAPGAARPELTVQQDSQRAIIDWKSFNISADSAVRFNQPGSTASALNRIYGTDPTVIQGQLSANGQIILINQNGILFDRGASVNVQSLIASTLNLKMSNDDFCGKSLAACAGGQALSAGGLGTEAFGGGYNDDGSSTTNGKRPNGQPPGTISLGSFGPASAAAPQLQAAQGGSILLFAPRIDNNGGIVRAPDGQVVLAAGQKVYLGISEDSSDTTLRGFVVEVEAVTDDVRLDLTNLVRNAGDISADRGNVTLAGLTVNQEGRVSAKTAVQANGSIYLKARSVGKAAGDATASVAQGQAGTATFAKGSVTEVMPDTGDTATVSDSTAYTAFRGVVDVRGGLIQQRGTVQAAGGVINLVASNAAQPSAARVYLDAESLTSVAGNWADVDFTKNIVSFRVTSNELKDAPDQKDGLLRGATVTVDLRQGSNILDLSGYRSAVARTVAEKAAVGGSMLISSDGDVIQRSGAVLDASGGGYRYNGGSAMISRLLGADGKIYDIGNAPEALAYLAQLDRFERTDSRWGKTVSIANPLGAVATYEAGYVEGKAAGDISISGKSGLVLDGTLKGGVTIGPRQAAAAPQAATLNIGASQEDSRLTTSLRFRNQAIDTLGAAFSAESSLGADAVRTFQLAADQLFGAGEDTADGRVEHGFGSVNIYVKADDAGRGGNIALPADVTLHAEPGAALNLQGSGVDLAGRVVLPGGSFTAVAGLADDGLNVRSTAVLSTAGAWVNQWQPEGAPLQVTGRVQADGSTRSTLQGGSIALRVTDPLASTVIERGAVLDVSGGALVRADKSVSGAAGGTLAIATGVQAGAGSDWLQGTLLGFGSGTATSAAAGGTLALTMQGVVIDGPQANGLLPGDVSRLTPSLFSDFGFSKISITAAGDLEVADGTTLAVSQLTRVIDPSAALFAASGSDIAQVSQVQRLPDWQRAAASVTLTAQGGGITQPGRLTVGRGASVVVDSRGVIGLSAAAGLDLQGTLQAAGGSITLGVTASSAAVSDAVVHVADTARIDVAGTFIASPGTQGLRQGTLLDAGSVTLKGSNAGVVVEAGAQIDLHGTAATVDLTGSGPTPTTRAQTLEGSAGTLLVHTEGRFQFDGTLQAQAGGHTAAGGSFALESERPQVFDPAVPDLRRIVVTDGSAAAPAPLAGVTDAVLDPQRLAAAGFDKLRLRSENQLAFQGRTTLDFARGVRLDAPALELLDGAQVTVRGSTVAMGQSLGSRSYNDTSGWVRNDALAAAPVATRSGTGTLAVDAGWVDLYGAFTVNGAALTTIQSDADVRLVGRSILYNDANGAQASGQIGSLTTGGNLEISAAQVYPATRSDFTLAVKDSASNASVPGGYLRVSRNDSAAGAVLSAGGTLTLQADHVVQDGVVKVPLGTLNLVADSGLSFGAGSLTSVSADGLTVPYGNTSAGTTWQYTDSVGSTLLNAVIAGGKRINISTAALDVRPGATLDLSGGGNVQAAEFVPGNGGSKDITLNDNTYAILPAASLAAAPYDAYIQSLKDIGSGFSVANGRDAARYDSITIGSGAAVPAGQYVLLPARYALLPGAYLVELQTGSAWRDLQPGQTGALANGQTVVAGYRSAAGSAVREQQSVGVVLRSGLTAVEKSSSFTLSDAGFFAAAAQQSRAAAPAAPWDAGRLVLQGLQSLSIAGDFATTPATDATYGTGRMAEVDIAGSAMAIVGSASTPVPEGTLKIESRSLNALNASVLLGGVRSSTADGVALQTTAGSITVANDAATPVQVPELILAANDSIDVRAGAVLEAAGSGASSSTVNLSAAASGALLRLSSGAQATVTRANASAEAGEITIAEGATLRASRSLLVDATRGTTSAGQLQVGGERGAGGSLALSATQVTLGDAGAGASGLVLSNDALAGYSALDAFIVHGYAGIDVAGSVAFGSEGLNALTLDTPLLRGVDTGAGARPVITARNVVLANSGGTRAASSAGTGTLTVQSQTLTLGEGEKAISGFGSTLLAASDHIALQGAGALRAGGDLQLQAPLVRALGGSAQTLSAEDNHDPAAVVRGRLALSGGTAAPIADAAEFGGRVLLQGRNVEVDSTLQARSGVITVQALGGSAEDGIHLGAQGRLDARGQALDFYGTKVIAAGGQVGLNAANGRVALDAGSAIDVSAAAEGGAAGRMEIAAGTLSSQGTLTGLAAAGATSGTAVLDLGALADFSTLNTQLNAGGFAAERDLRLRSGSLTVAAADQVAAERVTLSVDRGAITVLGAVGSGAANGGARVELHASDDIQLAAGSRLQAGTTAAGGKGGEVRVASAEGGVRFDAGATIDLRAGAGGMAGGVIFGVSRDATDTLAPLSLRGQVLRGGGVAAASVDVEATRRYDLANGVLDGTVADALADDHRGFIAAADAAGLGAALTQGLTDENGRIADARLLGATEVRSSGAMTVRGALALTDTATWYSGERPGTLTLRAGGDLTVLQSIGNADDSVQRGDTWNLRLAAGADLTAAHPLATVAGGSGNLVLGSADAKLRTGTGRIDLAAAGDIRFDDVGATVYTAGRIGVADAANSASNVYDRWTVDGGGISMRAGGDITGRPAEAQSLWVNDWLRRTLRKGAGPSGQPPKVVDPSVLTEWWTYRAGFSLGVGSFGGGDIDVAAGGNVEHLSLALPSSGRTVYVDNVRDVDVQGGGNLRLRAGGDLVGGDIVLGRGSATVEAAGRVGATNEGLQLWVQGLNGINGLQVQTRIEVSGGDGATLQSVNNPTALYGSKVQAAEGAPDPSLGTSGYGASFFTYGADTAVAVQAKAGNTVYAYQAATERSADHSTAANGAQGVAAVLPPQFQLAALGGDVGVAAGVSDLPTPTLYPSTESSLRLLAQGTLSPFKVYVSDLDPSVVVSPLAPITSQGNAFSVGRTLLGGGSAAAGSLDRVRAGGSEPRIVARRDGGASDQPFQFLTLEGDILGVGDPWYLPAPAKVIAGRDLLHFSGRLQNLAEGDLTILRAVEGDIREPQQIVVQGPGRLLLQAGRDIDLGGLLSAFSGLEGGVIATGNAVNTQLTSAQSARLTLLAGVKGDVDLAKLDGDGGVYAQLVALNTQSASIVNLYNQLALESNAQTVLDATSIGQLAAGNSAYARFVELDAKAPQALAAYQRALRGNTLPLASAGDVGAVAALYALLNQEADVSRLQAAGTLAALAQQPGGGAYAGYVDLATRYPLLYADYVQRRTQGAKPTSVMPVVFSQALADVVAEAIPGAALGSSGDIRSYQTSIQTFGGSGVDLLAPLGRITVGLTTQGEHPTGAITNAGGDIRAISQGNFDINLGKVLTVQGGDILLFSAAGSIDAGKGAKTAQVTATPVRKVTTDEDGNVTVTVTIPAGATGSGIQTLTSDPDGLGPLTAPPPGSVYLFAPAGTIDAGEAGIKSSGSLVLNAQTVLNASNISAAGPTTGVPVVQTGSLASALASGGTTTTPAKAAEDAAKQASEAARNAAAAAQAPKPTLLSVEVMGFGEKNCREDDKDCLGK